MQGFLGSDPFCYIVKKYLKNPIVDFLPCLRPFMLPDKRHTQTSIFKYVLNSTITGQLSTLHVVTIYFPIDNIDLLLFTVFYLNCS